MDFKVVNVASCLTVYLTYLCCLRFSTGRDILRLCEDLVGSIWHISCPKNVLIPELLSTHFFFFFSSKYWTILF